MSAQWRELVVADARLVVDLTRRCLAVDGGLPQSADDEFLTGRYFGPGCRALGGFVDGRLVASAATRPDGLLVAVVGQVDPTARGQGLGRYLLDWSRPQAGGWRVDTEAWSPSAGRLYARYGLARVFAEHVLVRPLADQHIEPAAGFDLEPYRHALAGDFYAAYAMSFADRPWPRRSEAEWLAWIGPDPVWSFLARYGTETAGFIACDGDFTISQVGVCPNWRRRGLARYLLSTAMAGMHVAGGRSALLMVNEDNPGAQALYRSMGFNSAGLRARYAWQAAGTAP